MELSATHSSNVISRLCETATLWDALKWLYANKLVSPVYSSVVNWEFIRDLFLSLLNANFAPQDFLIYNKFAYKTLIFYDEKHIIFYPLITVYNIALE